MSSCTKHPRLLRINGTPHAQAHSPLQLPRPKPKRPKKRPLDAQSAFPQRLLTPPPFYPPVEIPAHLMQRVKDCGRPERLVLWWLTDKLPVEREVDDATIADAARVARCDVAKIAGVRDAFPVHWGRM